MVKTRHPISHVLLSFFFHSIVIVIIMIYDGWEAFGFKNVL